MGRVHVVEFDQSDPDYFICKGCRTHIALWEDFFCLYTEPAESSNPVLRGGLFRKGVNLEVNKPVNHRQVGLHTVADVYCIKCGDNLGIKFIEVDPNILQHHYKGLLLLYTHKLLRLKGEKLLDYGDGQVPRELPSDPAPGN